MITLKSIRTYGPIAGILHDIIADAGIYKRGSYGLVKDTGIDHSLVKQNLKRLKEQKAINVKFYNTKKGKKILITVTSTDKAADLLEFFNKTCNRKFQPKGANISLISSLLKTYTEEDIKRVIIDRHAKWCADPKMSDYLRPSTIFRKSNFENYLNSIEEIHHFSQHDLL